MGNDKLTRFLSEKEIDELNSQLAQKITEDYTSMQAQSLLCIITLKGAIFFAADLIRKITIPIKVDFIRLSSYGSGTISSRVVKIVKDIDIPIKGQHVLVLDEIVDSGRTIAFLIAKLSAMAPKSLRVAALLSKPSRREISVHIDYCGKEVEDNFLVGYGLDFDEKYRQLKEIYSINQFVE